MFDCAMVMLQDLPLILGEDRSLPTPVGFLGMLQALPVLVQEVAVPDSGSTGRLGACFGRSKRRIARAHDRFRWRLIWGKETRKTEGESVEIEVVGS